MKCNSILEAIGRTPLIRLNRVPKDIQAEIYVKADYINPGGSVKDRVAISMIDEAERKGLLKPGGTIIEGTSGNTGVGLALVAAVRGYKVVFTITDKQSREKIDLLKAFGAEVIVCPTAVEPEDPRSYYSVAKKLSREIPNAYYPNQYENPMNPEAHYRTTGPEIWEDTEGKITHFVCGMGTGGTISGAGKFLKEKNAEIKVIGVDPVGSLYYEYAKNGTIGKARTYVVEGIGEDIFPQTMNFQILDDVLQVNDEECFVWARRLAKREGIFTGGSGGGCISAALRLAKTCKKGRPDRRVFAGHRKPISQQDLQRRLDARTRLCRFGGDADRIGCDPRKAPERQDARADHRRAEPNDLSRPENDAESGHFAATRFRRGPIDRHRVRGSDSEPRFAGKGFAEADRSRSDGCGNAAGAVQRSSGTVDLHTHSRQPGCFCGDGFRKT